jgi:SAM-dependent methyltransferase
VVDFPGVNSMDITFDEALDGPNDHTRITTIGPLDQIRTSYDMVAERYANELADEMLARPIERGVYLAFAELAQTLGKGPVGDIGCGPGHISKHLSTLGLEMLGIDISPTMIELARARFPAGKFWIGSMQQLPFPTSSWNAAISIWATLHCDAPARMETFHELARCVRRDGYLLHSFFISAPDQPPGSMYRLEKWFDYTVSLPTYFVAVDVATAELKKAGFTVQATMIREPLVSTELPTRRCYLLAQRK